MSVKSRNADGWREEVALSVSWDWSGMAESWWNSPGVWLSTYSHSHTGGACYKQDSLGGKCQKPTPASLSRKKGYTGKTHQVPGITEFPGLRWTGTRAGVLGLCWVFSICLSSRLSTLPTLLCASMDYMMGSRDCINGLLFPWLLVGFGQWCILPRDQRKKGEWDQDVSSLGSYLGECLGLGSLLAGSHRSS